MATAQNPTQHSYIVSPDLSSAGFNHLRESFEDAWIDYPHELVEAYYSFAGHAVRTRIVGRRLAAAYERAFAPRALNSAPHTPALTVDLWDQSVTGIPYPLPLRLGDNGQGQTAEGDWQYVDEGGRWVWGEKAEMASWLDLKANHIVGWRACGAMLPKHECSKPLASLLPWWFYHRGIDIFHAGVVARNGNGLLITGQGGIGKSTATLYCMQAGFDCLSDDTVALTPEQGGSGEFIAHSIYQSARFFADERDRFPNLQHHIAAGEDALDPKALVFLAEVWPGRLIDQARVGAIALARRSDQPQTRFHRATRGEAFKYVWLNSLITPLGVGRARFEHITQLISSAPCYWLDLGHDLTLIPPVIDQLIEEIS